MKVLLALWRRWRVRNDLYEEKPDRHPALRNVQFNEIVPWKGTNWRVQMIREQPFPCVILVPAGETRASKLGRLRELRRADRILTKQERAARSALEKRAAS